MCRHLAYLGPEVPLAELLTAPAHSLYEQSWAPRLQRYGTVNADGFGFGWYPGPDAGPDPAEPARYRRATPIWADPNLPDLLRTLRSTAVLAAVRSATVGTTQDESAAAPFRDGPWLFSHNGAVPDWTRLPDTGLGPEEMLGLEAHSDSALLWAALVRRLRHGQPAGAALADLVRSTAAARPTARLNLLLTDGRTIAATRHGDTLWYARADGRVLVASEPDDSAAPWQEVPDHSLLLATPADVHIAPLRPPERAPRPGDRADRTDRTPTTRKDADRMTSRFTLETRLPADHAARALRTDVLNGLGAQPRWLPPKWFYDARGSELFEEITRLPEYYPTRAEHEILIRRAPEIAALTRARQLVELGSGSSRKTRVLLDALTAAGTLECYAPLDVSASALEEAGAALCRDYPELRVQATVADFQLELALPQPQGPEQHGPRLLAFLGSTIGNLDTPDRLAFYALLRRALSADDALLLGADLVKDRDTLVRAYDDSQGVTAAFDKNVLQVLNRELNADFDLDAFDHVALWNEDEERIEMRLRSRHQQTVKIPDVDLMLDFAEGEELLTELSIKFRRESLTAELAAAGFQVRQWWTDQQERFALLLIVPD
jgi:dimethylhistidine N-methyltransferase/ergothioneine biosynthesis protein EgtC